MRGIVVALALMAAAPAAAFFSAAPALTAAKARSLRPLVVEMASTSGEMGIPCEDDCAIKEYPKLPASVHPGVVTGQALIDLLNHAQENNYAIPGVNCVSSSSINACLKAARRADAPIMIQFSAGGAQFYAGKGLDNTNLRAAIAGAVSGAYHVRAMAEQYGVPVILHTDHCAMKLLPWMDGMLDASEAYFKAHGEPLFSSHMLDLSEEPLEENLATCVKYLERMSKINMLLEMELGITGGEEDGVDNSDANIEDLYTKPEEVWETYQALSAVKGGQFSIAAAFGNVHGVYSPGNVKLEPEILKNSQIYIADKLGLPKGSLPVKFVFHGGSGSDVADIKNAIEYGVIKMNIDTDTQWSYWDGVRKFEAKNRPYLQTQIGNPEGPTKPNKKYYDPREMIRSAETTTVDRLMETFADLNCMNVCGIGKPAEAGLDLQDTGMNVFKKRKGGLPVASA